jgi:hypothetical protein
LFAYNLFVTCLLFVWLFVAVLCKDRAHILNVSAGRHTAEDAQGGGSHDVPESVFALNSSGTLAIWPRSAVASIFSRFEAACYR